MRIEFDQLRPGNIIQCDTYPPGEGTVVTYDQVNEKYKEEDFPGKEEVVAKKFDKNKLQAYGGTLRYPLHYARSVEFNKEWAAKLFKGKVIDGNDGTKIWEHEDGPYIKIDKQDLCFYYKNKDAWPIQFEFLHSLQNLYYETTKKDLIEYQPIKK